MNKPHMDSLGRDPDAGDRSVNNRPYLLDISFEFPFGAAGNLSANAAKIFSLTASGDLSARHRALTRKIAHSRHIYAPVPVVCMPMPLYSTEQALNSDFARELQGQTGNLTQKTLFHRNNVFAHTHPPDIFFMFGPIKFIIAS
jgi:hypothetical protein